MGSISDFTENELLDHIFNGAGAAYTPPTTVYLGLSTADPLDTGAGLAEPVGMNYARKAITFSAAASRAIAQNADVQFDQASGTWGLITHYATFDAVSSGNMTGHGSFGTPKNVISGNAPEVESGEVNISFLTLGTKADGSNNISDYLANILLNFVFRNQAFAQPSTYVALMTANAGDTNTGSTITEPSGFNYARKLVNANGGSSPTWKLAASGVIENLHQIDFNVPSGSWGAITATAIVDALTVGNLLMYDNSPGGEGNSPDNGDPVKINADGSNHTLI